jgi:hypothetical protein
MAIRPPPIQEPIFGPRACPGSKSDVGAPRAAPVFLRPGRSGKREFGGGFRLWEWSLSLVHSKQSSLSTFSAIVLKPASAGGPSKEFWQRQRKGLIDIAKRLA